MKIISTYKTPKQIYIFLLSFLLLNSCSEITNNSSTVRKSAFLLGKWTIASIENSASEKLDTASRQIYLRELKYFTDSAYISFQDTTFDMQIGSNTQKGRFHFYNGDSILLMISNKKDSLIFRLRQSKNFLTLFIASSKKGEKWKLVKN